MTSPPMHLYEEHRVAALRSLGLLDTDREERFDRYTRFARRLFDVPVAFVSLVDEARLWFKSMNGLEIRETPRETSFCGFAILDDDPLVVPDATLDDRFRENPVVTGEMGLRFYAGVPLRVTSGFRVGALCIADTKPREISEEELGMLMDLAAMLEQEFHSHSLATTDELTGLSNRRGFISIARQALAMCRRLDKAASLMFFDLDKFKTVNDNYGHAEGDILLKAIAEIMLHEFRNSDVVARLGGDEFCVLLTGTNAREADIPLQHLARAFEKMNDTKPYDVGYSVGTVPFDGERHKDVEDLLMEADAAMYRQKKAR